MSSAGLLPSMTELLGAPAKPEASVFTEQPHEPITFAHSELTPPTNLYVTINDSLILQANDLVGGRQIFLDYQILLPNGEIVQGEETVTTKAFSTGGVGKTIPLPEGFILRLGLRSINLAARGEIFGVVYLHRPPGINQLLLQGYLGATSAVGWPIGSTDFMTNGPGSLQFHVVTNPAAGTDWAFFGTSNVRTRIAMINATLTTSAAAANRGVVLQIDQQATPYYQAPASAVQAASLAVVYNAASGVTPLAPVAGVAVLGLPTPCMLGSFWRIHSVTSNLQAADQWSQITIQTEEWMDI